MAASMMFCPPLVLDNNSGDQTKNFPISLGLYSSASDMTELFRLRYRAFLDAGWIKPNASGALSDRYDRLPTAVTVGAFHNGECIGSLRLAYGGPDFGPGSMPCEAEFPNEVRAITLEGARRLVEFSRMSVEPTLTNKSFRTTLYASLVRAGLILTTAAQVDVAVVAVHKKISPFYQAMCGFKVLGRSVSYAEITEPTEFLGLKFHALEARRKRRNAFFAFSSEEVEAAKRTLAGFATDSAA